MARVLSGSIVLTFAVTRILLALGPNADLFVFGYNVHHAYTGMVLVALFAPAAVLARGGNAEYLSAGGMGIGISLALDEIVFLIATDGSNDAYLTQVSLVGGAITVAAAALYTEMLGRIAVPPPSLDGSTGA